MSEPKTSQMTVSSAQICRDLAWIAGDVLAAVEDPSFRIRLTAVGRFNVLAEQVEDSRLDADAESQFDLTCRDWRKVAP